MRCISFFIFFLNLFIYFVWHQLPVGHVNSRTRWSNSSLWNECLEALAAISIFRTCNRSHDSSPSPLCFKILQGWSLKNDIVILYWLLHHQTQGLSLPDAVPAFPCWYAQKPVPHLPGVVGDLGVEKGPKPIKIQRMTEHGLRGCGWPWLVSGKRKMKLWRNGAFGFPHCHG